MWVLYIMGRNISVWYAGVSLYIRALHLSCDFESAGVVCFPFLKNKTNQNYLSPDARRVYFPVKFKRKFKKQ